MMSATFAPVIVVGTYVTLRMIQYLQCDRGRGKTDIDELVLFEQGGGDTDAMIMECPMTQDFLLDLEGK